jgi:hypothetical protein
MADRVVLCGAARAARLPFADPNPLALDLHGPHPNVRLYFEEVLEKMCAGLPDEYRDLLEIAAYVYTADGAVPRGGGTDSDFGASWRRRLFFRVPVRRHDVWSDPRVRGQLVAMLGFLTEDVYEFDFVPMKSVPAPGYLDYGDPTLYCDVDQVILFSGGLDSLGGAVREAIVKGRRVLLVHHRAATKRVPLHDELLKGLVRHAGERRILHVPVWVDKSKELGREFTCRSRSFLFSSLGAALAVLAGRGSARLYENGVVSVNLPPAGQLVGARASRTTHPRVLCETSRLLSLLAGVRRPGAAFVVENPFLWSTKREVVELIAKAGCADLIRLTNSCSRTWEMESAHTHCGVCSQCVGRRFACLAAGQADADPADGYAVDLLTGGRPEGQHRTMLAIHLETATQISRAGAGAFFARYGEATRVLGHTAFPPEAAAAELHSLYRRHAEDLTGVTDRAVSEHAAALRERKLPEGCLIRLTAGQGADAAGRVEERPENVFRRKNKVWEAWFEGGEEIILLPHKGAEYLHALLASPNHWFSAAELACAFSRSPCRLGLSGGTESVDREALAAYGARHDELRQQLEEARADEDEAAEAECLRQMALLSGEVKRGRGRGGRARRASDDLARVRRAVGIALRRTLKEIAEADPELAEHLKPPRLVCGSRLSYRPDPQVDWET